MFALGLNLATLIEWRSIVYSIIALSSTILILTMSPVEAENKKLTEEQIKRNREKSIIIVFFEFILSFILYLLDVSNVGIRIFYAGIAFASASLIMAKIAHRKTCKLNLHL